MRTPRLLFLAALLTAPAVYLSACGSDDSSSPTAPDSGTFTGDDSSTGSDTSTGGDGSSGGDGSTTDSGVISLDFDPTGDGDPISLTWSEKSNKLWIADNKHSEVWSWSDDFGFKKEYTLAPLPAGADAGEDLGQIVELANGTLVVPRFGFGTAGQLLYADTTNNTVGAYTMVDPTRRRTALTVDSDGRIWGGYFFSATAGTAVVTSDALNGDGSLTESDFATMFKKPVGVLVVDGKLLVSDQTDGKIYSIPRDGTKTTPPYDVFAEVPSTDALTAGPNGSVITGQFRPNTDGGPLQVRQAFSDGGVVVLDAGVSKPQGVAYDATNKRLFIADSNGTTLRTIKIIPLE